MSAYPPVCAPILVAASVIAYAILWRMATLARWDADRRPWNHEEHG
jgi:hypothetical protein